jgi:hypothetical protein
MNDNEELSFEEKCELMDRESGRKNLEKTKQIAAEFLGKGKRFTQAIVFPMYYHALLAWALQRQTPGKRPGRENGGDFPGPIGV